MGSFRIVCSLGVQLTLVGCNVWLPPEERPTGALRGASDPWVSTARVGTQPSDCLLNTLPSDTLASFAQKCDAATGITVPAFDCDAGTVVPTTVDGTSAWISPENGGSDATIPLVEACDRPNVLNSECDPGSRFQIVAETDDAIAVAHCRKQGYASGYYHDVAVIQYNRVNGATCFYQALGTLYHEMPAPAADDTTWMLPAEVANASFKCLGCHDNGPFVRSPYLAQLRDEDDRVPGTREGEGSPWDHRFDWNRTLPYEFVGNDFQAWKAYSFSHDGEGALCTSCHRLGTSSDEGVFESSYGTAGYLGPIATDEEQTSKLPHSDDAPIWMLPGQVLYDAPTEAAASAMQACAQAAADGTTNPACHLVQHAQGDTCPDADVVTTLNGATQSEPTSERVHTVVDLSVCADGECAPGFCSWTSVHGPFWQTSDGALPLADPAHRGSYVRIFSEDGVWKAESFSDPTGGPPMAPPGGAVACVQFDDIVGVADGETCFQERYAVVDPDGTTLADDANLGSKSSRLGVFTGMIGNIAVSNGSSRGTPADVARVTDDGRSLLLAFAHGARRVLPSALELEARSFGCDGWKPSFVAQNVYSTGDVQLVGPELARGVHCYITGLSGTWNVTHDGGTVQPYAEVYWGPSGDRRLRVVPTGATGATEAVGAYASCIAVE